MPTDPPICRPKSLPAHLVIPAARVAAALNPANAPAMHPEAPPLSPGHLAVLTSAYWPSGGVHLTVDFLEPTPDDLADRIVAHANAWSRTANVRYVRSKVDPIVRITREGSEFWSYLGPGSLTIPKNEPTMTLGGFTMATPESEFRRVVRHEFGHQNGFPHEHLRPELVAMIDPAKAVPYYRAWQGWDEETTRSNVLTPMAPGSFRASAPDQNSVMCYQIAREITYDGQPILGGLDIDELDYQFAGMVYPLPDARPMSPDQIMRALENVL